jgi:hypothetical protein
MDANEGGANRERTDSRRARRRRARRIQFAGQLVASALSGAVTALLALVLAFFFFAPRGGPGWFDRGVVFVTAAPFEERTPRGVVNASAIVPLGDSRFLIVDDLTDDAFFEIAFAADGRKSGPLVRRPVSGLSSDVVQDLEDATRVDVAGRTLIVAVSSLEADEGEPTDAGLVRVTVGEGGALSGEVMPGFRSWLLSAYPVLNETRGGPSHLDVQGIVWDPRRSALLLAARSATETGKPLLLPIRVRDWAGPWTTDNLEKGAPIELQLGDRDTPKGISGIAWDERDKAFMLIVNDVPSDRRPYALYTWDGGDSGAVVHSSDVLFDPRMRPEGVAFGTIGGRPASVLVDDNGGYYVFWQDVKNT